MKNIILKETFQGFLCSCRGFCSRFLRMCFPLFITFINRLSCSSVIFEFSASISRLRFSLSILTLLWWRGRLPWFLLWKPCLWCAWLCLPSFFRRKWRAPCLLCPLRCLLWTTCPSCFSPPSAFTVPFSYWKRMHFIALFFLNLRFKRVLCNEDNIFLLFREHEKPIDIRKKFVTRTVESPSFPFDSSNVACEWAPKKACSQATLARSKKVEIANWNKKGYAKARQDAREKISIPFSYALTPIFAQIFSFSLFFLVLFPLLAWRKGVKNENAEINHVRRKLESLSKRTGKSVADDESIKKTHIWIFWCARYPHMGILIRALSIYGYFDARATHIWVFLMLAPSSTDDLVLSLNMLMCPRDLGRENVWYLNEWITAFLFDLKVPDIGGLVF